MTAEIVAGPDHPPRPATAGGEGDQVAGPISAARPGETPSPAPAGPAAGHGGPLGIVAGGGSVPLAVAERAVAAGRAVHIIGLVGEADAAIEGYPHTWVKWGAIGAMLAALADAGCREIVIVGRVSRPKLSAIRPDLGLLRALPEVLALRHGGDDSVLSRVVRFFERRGFRVLGAHELAPALVMGEGRLGRYGADPASVPDIALAFRLLEALGPFDVGQAAVVVAGRVVAIEGVEGTDAMLRRAAAAVPPRPAGAPSAGVAVKRPKPGQEMRVDMPTIGPRTVELASRAGLAGLAVLAGQVLITDRQEIAAAADGDAMFVEGIGGASLAASAERRDGEPPEGAAVMPSAGSMEPGLEILAGRPRATDVADIALGRAVSRVTVPFGAGDALVVARRHVLAISGTEPPAETLARAAGLRQWGLGRVLNGRGVAVVRARLVQDREVGRSLARAAKAAGLAGVAVVAPRDAADPVGASFVEACKAARVFVARIEGR